MTSSHVNAFRVTGPLWGAIGYRWNSLANASFDIFLISFKQIMEQTVELSVIWDALMPIVM